MPKTPSDPYVVTENNYGIVRLQPAAGDVPGVFFRHRRETLATVYDRTPNDPHVRHNLVVDVDPATGLAREEAAIAYGRRATVHVVAADGSVSTIANPGLEALDPVDRAVQTRVQITWTEHRYATPVSEPDDHRVDMLAESTMWELSGFRPAERREPLLVLRAHRRRLRRVHRRGGDRRRGHRGPDDAAATRRAAVADALPGRGPHRAGAARRGRPAAPCPARPTGWR